MTLNKKGLSIILGFISILAIMLLANDVFAATPNFVTGDQSRMTAEASSSALNAIITTMYNVGKYLSALIFGVAVIVIVWAGFKYATSQGETKTMETAKMQIIAAGIGIGVTLLAMIIVKVFYEIFGTTKASTAIGG